MSSLRPGSLHFALVIVAVILLTASSASASTLWEWAYSGAGISASGLFTAADTPDPDGGYLITGISGTRNGILITGLQTPGTSIPGNEPYTVDDLIFPGPGPQLTKNGFGFSIVDGTYANPFYADFLPTPGYLEFYSTPPFVDGTPGPGSSELAVQFSATPVLTPEPATFGLSLTALGWIWAWRRVHRDAPTAQFL
jgi:hypothetical protein